jgi:four helix bundle protein
MKICRFEDIEAWQLARELTRMVYRLTRKAGFGKDLGLKRQIQQSAGSAMHNIAEGFDSETNSGVRSVLAICETLLLRGPE